MDPLTMEFIAGSVIVWTVTNCAISMASGQGIPLLTLWGPLVPLTGECALYYIPRVRVHGCIVHSLRAFELAHYGARADPVTVDW